MQTMGGRKLIRPKKKCNASEVECEDDIDLLAFEYFSFLSMFQPPCTRNQTGPYFGGVLLQHEDWFLQHDNATAHAALSVRRVLTPEDITLIPDAPHFCDRTPRGFFLFPCE